MLAMYVLKETKNAFWRFLVPEEGLEPSRPFGTADFESALSSDSSTPA